ncbi:cytidylate kinase [Taylorella asinigenitalis 14/45]|uniref:Cytidylate kinase n=1 Tax=Taylorella asinigenitalis 14/45 TaxID=1091495 RepID=I7JLV0_9BURK|nr:(d)CMP kinase [Taylorella asinigenitalis]CCG19213.1 cytidylate kinase [Taylorella asinigenitalis 14/45]
MKLITIDGPSASGKGTVSQRVAEILGWDVLDSGALYRLSALACLNLSTDLKNIQDVVSVIKNMQINFCDGLVFLNSNNVTDAIRTEHVGNVAAQLATIPEVRKALVNLQHSFLKEKGLVADGRDMGTVIFPQAPLKIFLISDLETRALRRFNQIKDKNPNITLDAIRNDMRNRDEQDRNRSIAPLVAAKDAITIDTTSMSIDEVVNFIIQKWKFFEKFS